MQPLPNSYKKTSLAHSHSRCNKLTLILELGMDRGLCSSNISLTLWSPMGLATPLPLTPPILLYSHSPLHPEKTLRTCFLLHRSSCLTLWFSTLDHGLTSCQVLPQQTGLIVRGILDPAPKISICYKIGNRPVASEHLCLWDLGMYPSWSEGCLVS